LVGTVEKSISLNLIKIILKFGFVLMTCSRSLKIGLVPLASLEELFWKIVTRQGKLVTYFSYLLSNRTLE